MSEAKEKVQFWMSALSNPAVNKETVALINQCLQNDLKEYLNEGKEE